MEEAEDYDILWKTRRQNLTMKMRMIPRNRNSHRPRHPRPLLFAINAHLDKQPVPGVPPCIYQLANLLATAPLSRDSRSMRS
jgi:hypothetical protein